MHRLHDKEFKISKVLIQVFLNNELTDEQEKELKSWLNESIENQKLFDELKVPALVRTKLEDVDLVDKKSIWFKTVNKLRSSGLEFTDLDQYAEKEEGGALIYRLWPKFAVAITLLIAVGLSIWFFNGSNHAFTIQEAQNDIMPGVSGATLTLSDGKKIRLSDVVNGEFVKVAGSSVIKTKEGSLEYLKNNSVEKKTEYNELSTNLGERYQLLLPDSTKVWLNAGSSIKFPTTFSKLSSRIVEVSGEAYFEVKKDKKHPFIVKNAYQEIEVLGTHFNVNSYPDDKSIKTTLLEGSIRLITSHNNIVLAPGQQAINTNINLTVKDINPSIATAWKNGEFHFVNEDLESIMKIIARWYNVEVYYNNPDLKKRTFYASVSCFKNMSDVLKKFEITQKVRFTIKGRRVYVN